MLITGGKGILGRELVKIFTNALNPSHAELELAHKDAVFKYFSEHNIDFIIHAAALANVRVCEENKTKAWSSNVIGTENLVNATLQCNPNAYFVYISTACVFDGKGGMYNENDVPYPENFYALTKLLGEFIVKKLQNYLIIRTNFVPREKWRYPKAFTDRCGTYLFADDAARAIKEVIDAKMNGIVHVVGDQNMSMFELARITTKDVEPMTIKDYTGPKLTMNMSLDTVRWKRYRISR
jgi:dTDP-4-dehydrorhamnose reductase